MKPLLILFIFILAASCKDKKRQVQPVNKSTDTTEGKIIPFVTAYNFGTFKILVFTGREARPDFSGDTLSKDTNYVKFISKGCRNNKINFGGHYTIIQKSCGALCESIFIVDRISGKIYADVTPADGRYGYLYKADSRLLIANSNTFQDDSLKYYNNFFGEPELYVWETDHFRPLK